MCRGHTENSKFYTPNILHLTLFLSLSFSLLLALFIDLSLFYDDTQAHMLNNWGLELVQSCELVDKQLTIQHIYRYYAKMYMYVCYWIRWLCSIVNCKQNVRQNRTTRVCVYTVFIQATLKSTYVYIRRYFASSRRKDLRLPNAKKSIGIDVNDKWLFIHWHSDSYKVSVPKVIQSETYWHGEMNDYFFKKNCTNLCPLINTDKLKMFLHWIFNFPIDNLMVFNCNLYADI